MKGLFFWPFQRKQIRWALSCSTANWTAQDLSLLEARAILSVLRESEKERTLVWRTGWRTWRPLHDPLARELLYTRIVHIQAPPLPQMTDEDSEITVVRPPEFVSAPSSTRKCQRFHARYSARLISGTREFLTETVDVSEAGFRFQETLPDWVAGYTTLIVTTPGGSFELVCHVAEDQTGEDRTRVELVASDKQIAFVDWFRSCSEFST